MRTISLTSTNGTLLRKYTHSSITDGVADYDSSVGGTNARFDISVINNKYNVKLNTTNFTPNTYVTGDYLIYYGGRFSSTPTSSSNNFNVTITATSPNFATFTVSGLPYQYYGQVKFTIPPIKNLIYAEWLAVSNFAEDTFCQINEFVNGGIATNGLSYWRFISNQPTINSIPDRLPITDLIPRTHNTLTINLYDITGTIITNFTGPWTIELVLYSKEILNE